MYMDVKIQEKKSFFLFVCFFLDDDPFLCSVFSQEKYPQGIFSLKNTSTSERIFDASPAWNFGLWSSTSL